MRSLWARLRPRHRHCDCVPVREPAPIAPPPPQAAYGLPEGTVYDDGLVYRGWLGLDGDAHVPMPGYRVGDR